MNLELDVSFERKVIEGFVELDALVEDGAHVRALWGQRFGGLTVSVDLKDWRAPLAGPAGHGPPPAPGLELEPRTHSPRPWELCAGRPPGAGHEGRDGALGVCRWAGAGVGVGREEQGGARGRGVAQLG